MHKSSKALPMGNPGAQFCFIFECFCEGTLLFRACSDSSGLPDPLPDGPAARALQADALQNGCRLTYSFVATGLTKAEASILMRGMAANEAVRAADSRQPVEVQWLPGSGVCRLPVDRRSRLSKINSTAIPLEK